MRILILSCGTGGGHNDAARGAAEALRAHGHEASLAENYLSLAGKKVDTAVCGSYIGIVKVMPGLFGGVYQLGRGVSSLLHKTGVNSPVSWANAKMAPHLETLVREKRYDAVLCTHLFPAETLTRMKAAGTAVPPVFAVATDYTSIPFWEETHCDGYIVPTQKEVIDDFCRRGVPERALLPFGIPAPIAYTTHFDRAAVRAALGFSPAEKVLLVMGGSMGAGDLDALVGALLRRVSGRTRCFVMTGSNEKLYRRLSAKYADQNAVTVLPHVDSAAPYLQACDLLFTKPGGLTSTEAVLSRAPTVLLDPLSPCETANRNTLVAHRCAVAPKGAAARAEWGLRLLRDETARTNMQRSQAAFLPENPAEALTAYLESQVG